MYKVVEYPCRTTVGDSLIKYDVMQHPSLRRPDRVLRRDLRAAVPKELPLAAWWDWVRPTSRHWRVAIGLSEISAGLVGSLPLVMGGLVQMITPAAVRRLGSHKRWVVVCAACQSITFAPLVFFALLGSVSGTTLLAVAAVYWGAGLATGPAWNFWIGTIVPRSIRPRFFAFRTRGQQAGVFAGFLLGGMLLQLAAVSNRTLMAYALLFAAAGICRMVSTALLALQSEPVPLPAKMRQVPWRELRKQLAVHHGGRLLVYLIAMQASVQIAGPYFTPYMFEKLNFNYAQFVALISIAFLAKTIALSLLGNVAKRIGAMRLLWLGGIGIVPLSGCWLIAQNLPWLLFVQLVGGIVWAAYELAFFLLFFESIPEEDRTSLLTVYNLLNTVAWVLGALVGGGLLYAADSSGASYLWIFAVSSAARCGCLLLLARVPAYQVLADRIGVRSVAVRPNSASLDLPVLSSLPDQTTSSE